MIAGLSQWDAATMPRTDGVGGRARKTSIYDTEVILAAVAVPSPRLIFRDFGAFAVAAVGLTKQRGRDVNLQGRAGLPKGQHHFIFEMTYNLMARQANLTTLANVVVPDELRRIRELSSFTFFFTDNPYIRQPLTEIPAGCGLAYGNTTHTDTTLFQYSWSVPHRDNAFGVHLGGEPLEITEVESFHVEIETPEAAPAPTVQLSEQAHIRGVLLKAITG